MHTLSEILNGLIAERRAADGISQTRFLDLTRELVIHVARIDVEQRRLRGLISDFDGHVKDLAKLREQVNGMDTAIESLQDDIKQTSDTVDSIQNALADTEGDTV